MIRTRHDGVSATIKHQAREGAAASVLVVAVCAISLAAGIAAWAVFDRLKWKAKFEALNARIADATSQSRDEWQKAREDAALELQAARAAKANVEAEIERKRSEQKSAIEIIRDRELHRLYPTLKPLEGGVFLVDEKYVREFRMVPPSGDVASAQEIEIVYENSTKDRLTPNVQIYFLNEFGLATDWIKDEWMIDTIAPGERRVERKYFKPEHGAAVYWRIEVK